MRIFKRNLKKYILKLAKKRRELRFYITSVWDDTHSWEDICVADYVKGKSESGPWVFTITSAAVIRLDGDLASTPEWMVHIKDSSWIEFFVRNEYLTKEDVEKACIKYAEILGVPWLTRIYLDDKFIGQTFNDDCFNRLLWSPEVNQWLNWYEPKSEQLELGI